MASFCQDFNCCYKEKKVDNTAVVRAQIEDLLNRMVQAANKDNEANARKALAAYGSLAVWPGAIAWESLFRAEVACLQFGGTIAAVISVEVD